MRDELRKLQKRLGITSLYVTHDQEEAMAISDRIVIMQDGVIRQVGTPRQIYEHPETKFVANFMGKANFVEAEILGTEGDAATVRVEGRILKLPRAGHSAPKSGKASLVVRPEAIHISRSGSGGGDALPGRVERLTYFGNIAQYEIKAAGTTLLAERYNPQASELHDEGSAVDLEFAMEPVRLLAEKDPEGRTRGENTSDGI